MIMVNFLEFISNKNPEYLEIITTIIMWRPVFSFFFLTSSTNKIDGGCMKKMPGADLLMDQARSGFWVGG